MRSVVLASVVLAACAEPQPPPPPTPAAPATKEAPPPPEPEAAPTASAKADAAKPPEPAEQKGSGRIPVLKSDPEEITDTFGSPPAKLEIGEGQRATLKIPENALSSGVNLTFKIDKKGKATGTPVGKIYRITAVIPPAATPSKIETAGPSFELSLPAGDKKDANLAIGEIVTDDKGKEKIVWTVIAPLKIDDATGTAHFELKALPNAYLHVTAKAVTPAPAP